MGGFEPIADLVNAVWVAVRSPDGQDVVVLFVAGVLVLSSVAKLRHPRLAALAIADFGLVGRPQRAYGIALGLFELGLAGALVIQPGSPVVLGALSLTLLVFTGLIVRALRGSERFACFCFGGEEELSRATLLRNIVLLVLVAVLWTAPVGGGSAIARYLRRRSCAASFSARRPLRWAWRIATSSTGRWKKWWRIISCWSASKV